MPLTSAFMHFLLKASAIRLFSYPHSIIDQRKAILLNSRYDRTTKFSRKYYDYIRDVTAKRLKNRGSSIYKEWIIALEQLAEIRFNTGK